MDIEHGQQQPESAGEEQSAATQDAPPASRVALWRRRSVQVVAAITGVAGVAVGAWLAGRNSSNTGAASTPTASPSPSSVVVFGSLTIPFLGPDLSLNARDTAIDLNATPSVADPCVTLGGYTDISAGAAVTIGGAQGQTLSIGPLAAGQVYAATAGGPAECRFEFSVTVPGGQSVYTVTISHRGTQTFTPEQVAQGIDLTLGQ